jgi:class 3 adenylate cyclase
MALMRSARNSFDIGWREVNFMEGSMNPYNCSRPGNLFVGYTDTRARILKGLVNGKSFALLGGRRCGKTSFLLKLEEDFKQTANQNFVPSIFDIQALVPRSTGEFFGAIYAMTVEGTQAEHWSGVNYQDFLSSLDRGRGLIEQRYGSNWVRVLLIDELDAGAAKLPDSECFQNLRNLLMNSRYSRHFRVVATGVSSLSDLITDRSSPLNNLDPQYLGTLPIDATRALTTVGFTSGLSVDTETILFSCTGRHPYILQGMLEYLWDCGSDVNENTIKSASRRFARDRASTFRRWIYDFRREGCAVYDTLSHESVSIKQLRARISRALSVDDGLTTLSYHGVIDESDPELPRVGSTIFRDWFQENYKLENDPPDGIEEAATPHSLAATMIDVSGSRPISSLEIAHVLFMDIVSYSTMPMDEQRRMLSNLQELVRNNSEFAHAQAEDQLIRLPTGDGMALVFFHDPVSPVRCALELSRVLRGHPEIKLRMGIHSGPVYRVADINANRNVAGGGINIAQRVMDCGDSGHILVSSSVADVLVQLTEWKDSLQDLGDAVVKHGVRIRVFNMCTENAGNEERPQKLRANIKRKRIQGNLAKRRWPIFVLGAVLIIVILLVIFLR